MTGSEAERRDKRGRRIGYNWWREHCWSVWHGAHEAWLREREAECIGHPGDEALYGAYGESHHTPPRPTYKQALIQNAGLAESLMGVA